MTDNLYHSEDIDDPTFIIDDFVVIDDEGRIDALELFRYAATQNCSDIHLKVGAYPKLRIHGKLIPIKGMRRLTSTDTNDIRQETMSDVDFGQFVSRKYDHNYAYEIPGVGRYRISLTLGLGASNLIARKLVETPPTFDDLGTNPVIRDLINFSSGLIIVAGITGSGKSTLMAAMINEINHTQPVNIVSIESPVEIIHKDLEANVIQRNVGTDVIDFTTGVKDAMRQDPDIILIGEINDVETARAALRAAESGHLVVTTTHSQTAVSAIGKIIELFGSEEATSIRHKISESLRSIVMQKLVPSTHESGQLVPVNEILLNTPDMQKKIEDNDPPSELRKLLEASRNVGMQTFEHDFMNLVNVGIITAEVALAQAENKPAMQALLDAAQQTQVQPAELQVEQAFDFDEDTDTEIIVPSPAMFPTKNGFPQLPPLQQKPVMSFSEKIKAEEEKSGVVIKPSGAAPELPKAPIRPNIYLPK